MLLFNCVEGPREGVDKVVFKKPLSSPSSKSLIDYNTQLDLTKWLLKIELGNIIISGVVEQIDSSTLRFMPIIN